MTTVSVTLHLKITDANAFRMAAHDHALSDGLSEDDAAQYLDPLQMNLGHCARMLLDAGESPAGSSILDSEADVEGDATESDDDEDQNSGTNYYRCTTCGTEWEDTWSCACDDECPKCGTTMAPYDSEHA